MTKMSSLMIFVLPKDSDGEQMFYWTLNNPVYILHISV
jgi:hypothetical protein